MSSELSGTFSGEITRACLALVHSRGQPPTSGRRPFQRLCFSVFLSPCCSSFTRPIITGPRSSGGLRLRILPRNCLRSPQMTISRDAATTTAGTTQAARDEPSVRARAEVAERALERQVGMVHDRAARRVVELAAQLFCGGVRDSCFGSSHSSRVVVRNSNWDPPRERAHTARRAAPRAQATPHAARGASPLRPHALAPRARSRAARASSRRAARATTAPRTTTAPRGGTRAARSTRPTRATRVGWRPRRRRSPLPRETERTRRRARAPRRSRGRARQQSLLLAGKRRDPSVPRHAI